MKFVDRMAAALNERGDRFLRIPYGGAWLVIDGVAYTVVSHWPEYETGNRRRMGVEIELKETS